MRMEEVEEREYVTYNGISISDSSAPLSRALLLHRVMNGVLLFMLPVVVGASFYGGLEGRCASFWNAWWKLSHLLVLFSVIMAVKQYKVMLFRVSVALQAVWMLVSLSLLVLIVVDARKLSIYGDVGLAARMMVPVVLFWILVEALIVLSGFLVLREPIRPKSVSKSGRRGGENGRYEFEIWDDAEMDVLQQQPKTEAEEGHDDGLERDANVSSSPESTDERVSELYATLSTPTGIARWLPFFMQVASIIQAILWPLYFVDVIAALMNDGYLAHRKAGALLGLTITYHYAMLIWFIAALIISFQFRNKRRTWFASLVGLAYLGFCFTLAILKLALWHADYYSPIFTVIHILILAPWCAAAYYIGTNYFDYSLVPTCCCS